MSSLPSTTPGSRERWRALLLSLVFNLLMFESLSGFVLFFARGFLSAPQLLGAAHWWLGVLLAVPYSIYQWRHYLRVRGFSDVLQYQVGLTSFVTLLIVIISGLVLYFLDREMAAYVIVDLIHIMLGFAFLILISTHLVLVYRVGARENAAKGVPGFRAMVLARVLWLPLVLSTALVTAVLWWGRA